MSPAESSHESSHLRSSSSTPGSLAGSTPGSPARFPVLCDLDGVVWLAHRPIPGSVEAIARLRAAGHRVLFVTNNSSSQVARQEETLGSIGIPAVGDVLTSAMAAALLVEPGERVLVCGGEGVVEALERRGAEVVCTTDPFEGSAATADVDSRIDAVVVGWHRTFDYDGLTRAALAVQRGARLIGTNDDATYPTPDGAIPGGGSLLAAVQTASGVSAQVAGKPHGPMADLVRREVGTGAAALAVMVGDRPSTDGRFARTLGCRYAHVRSGVTEAGAPLDPSPDVDLPDLAAVAELVVRGGL